MADEPVIEHTNPAGCLTRLYWIFLGNALLFFAVGMLIDKRPKFPALLDAVCLFAMVSLVAVRYIDIRYYKGETGDGTLATMEQWRKYALILVTGSIAVWAGARFVVPMFLK